MISYRDLILCCTKIILTCVSECDESIRFEDGHAVDCALVADSLHVTRGVTRRLFFIITMNFDES